MRSPIKLLAALLTLGLYGANIPPAHAAASSPPFLSATTSNDDQRNTQSPLAQRTRLRFLTTTDFAPFNVVSPQGKLSGYHIDLVKALCQELALTAICQIEARPWSELAGNLQNGSADAIIAGIVISSASRQNFSFTRPYLSLPARFVALKSKTEDKENFSPDRQKIGVITNTQHDILLKSYFPQANITSYKTNTALYTALTEGKVSAIFGDAMTFAQWINSNNNDSARSMSACCQFVGGNYPAPQILGQGMAIALGKDDETLRNALNNALRGLEHKGVLEALYLRYFPVGFF